MTSLPTTHCTLLTYGVCVISVSVRCGVAFIGNRGVYFRSLRVHEFIEKVLEFGIGRSWNVVEFPMSKCV